MAKKITGSVKLQIAAGKATPAPPVGPALGQAQINIMEFCKQFNARTSAKELEGLIIPVVISVYNDRSFTFITKTPPASILLKRAAGIAKGSGAPNKDKVGKVTLKQVEDIAKQCRAVTCRLSNSEDERLLFWAGRKAAFPAVGRISPDYYCMDGTIPRAKLPLVLQRMQEMSAKYDLRVANVFHAGDGNLHPLILYDANNPGELERAENFGADILRLCVEVGGVLTGEHGVGVEKRDLMPVMFSEIDLNQQQRVKCAFDGKSLLNPGKVFPTLHRCAELGRMHVHAGRVAFPDIPRF